MKRPASFAAIRHRSIGEKVDSNHASALIELKVSPKPDKGFDDIADRIMQLEEVESVYLMSGGFDLAVHVNGRSMRNRHVRRPKLSPHGLGLIHSYPFYSQAIQGRRAGDGIRR